MRKYNVSVVGYSIIEKYKIDITKTISIDSDIEVSNDSLFQSCSFSKSVTAAGILKLCGLGKIDLDKPINAQLKSWKISQETKINEVNARQCLSMTSGLCYGALKASFSPYTQDKPVPSLKDILQGKSPATNFPVSLSFAPGTDYDYSGAGYMVLQQVIEDVTGTSFADYMQSEILNFFNMKNSIFQHPLNEKWKVRAIPGFDINGKILKGGWDNIPSFASGGLWSTPFDLANFVLGITKSYLGIDTDVIQKKLAIEMLTRQKNSSFGLGVVVDVEGKAMNFRKNGYNTGYHNELIMFPNAGQGIVVMTNSAVGMPLIKEFIAFIAHRYAWQSYSLEFNESTV